MEFSAQQIATMAGGSVDGNPDVMVSTIAKIEEGKPGSITFLANPKYTHFIYSTEASIVLVANDFTPEQEVKATLIRVADPYGTVTHLLQMVSQMMTPQRSGIEQPCFIAEGVEVPEDAYIGAFAYIGRGAKLGSGVKIYPQAYIGDGVTVGDGTTIYAGAKIYHNCHVGERCIIHAGAVVGADGFGFAPNAQGSYDKIPQIGCVVIGDDVEIGANTTIDRATMGETRIHNGVKLDNLVQIAHNCEIGSNTVMAAQGGVAGSTKIGSHCVTAGQVGFAGHIHIGDRVTVGAQSGVPNNVTDGRTIMGYPAVDARQFLRQAAYIKHIGELNDRVKKLENALSKLTND